MDEMFPTAVARLLRAGRDDLDEHDAVHVREVGLGGSPDNVVAEVARLERRALVTENVADFAHERDMVLVCIRKRDLPPGGAQAAGLAALLDRWSRDNARPYLGQHWPT